MKCKSGHCSLGRNARSDRCLFPSGALTGFVAVALLFCLAAGSLAGPPSHLPKWSKLEPIAQAYLAKLPDYEPGDLLTRGVVEPLIDQLVKAGLPSAEKAKVLGLVLSDDDFIAKQLSTPKGRRFMRKISGYPGGYDRLYRLSKIPGGQRQVDRLVHAKDGYLLIEYLCTTREGKNTGSMLKQKPGGTDLNEPTGLIFTADNLLADLKQRCTPGSGERK